MSPSTTIYVYRAMNMNKKENKLTKHEVTKGINRSEEPRHNEVITGVIYVGTSCFVSRNYPSRTGGHFTPVSCKSTRCTIFEGVTRQKCVVFSRN